MYVFSYDPQTLAFQGGIPAEFDQLDLGRLICPAFASRTPIPKFDAVTQWPYYVADPADPEGGSWELRPIPKEDQVAPAEPDPAPAPPPERADAILEAIQLHLKAVELLRAEITTMAADAKAAATATAARAAKA